MDTIRKVLAKEINACRVVEENDQPQASFNCPRCQDRGLIIEGDTAYPCQCVHQQADRRRFISSNITPLMADFTFDHFSLNYYSNSRPIDPGGPTLRAVADRALNGGKEFVARYLEVATGRGLLLEGNVGSGKTFLAGAITNALLAHDKQVLFLVVPDFLDDLRATFQKQGEFREADLMEMAKKAEVLVLDDLGAHNFTEWTQNRIFSLINYRMNHSLPTIITTNLSLEEMNPVIGARTVSRIIETCKIFRLYVEEDIRCVRHRER